MARTRKKRPVSPEAEREVPLAANCLLEGLPQQDRDRAVAACIRKRYRRGETVFSAGDPPEFLYFLEAGYVRLVSLAADGTERILHIFRPGDIFGEIFLSVEHRPFSAVVVEEAQVAILSKATFLQFLSSSPQWGVNFIRLMSDRLFATERDLAALARTWTRPRLVHLLLKLAETLGERTPQGTRIVVPVTHEALAHMIGASRVRVTAALSQLKREGVVAKQGRLWVARTDALKNSITRSNG